MAIERYNAREAEGALGRSWDRRDTLRDPANSTLRQTFTCGDVPYPVVGSHMGIVAQLHNG